MPLSPPQPPTDSLLTGNRVVEEFSENSGAQQSGQQLDMSQFTDAQRALQGQSLGFISRLLSGGSVPQTFGLPQSVYDAAFYNFNRYQAPILANQFGAGSPMIAGSMNELQLQLAGLAGRTAMSNAINAFDAAAKFAFTPVGNQRTFNENQTGFRNYTRTLSGLTADIGGLLGTLPSFF